MTHPKKMKTFDIDPLFEILDYAEELEKKAIALIASSRKGTKSFSTVKADALADLKEVLKTRNEIE